MSSTSLSEVPQVPPPSRYPHLFPLGVGGIDPTLGYIARPKLSNRPIMEHKQVYLSADCVWRQTWVSSLEKWSSEMCGCMLGSTVQPPDTMNQRYLKPHINLKNMCHIKKKYNKVYGTITFTQTEVTSIHKRALCIFQEYQYTCGHTLHILQ